ncbi:MAG: hypothetical protein JXA25_16715 [Anaerolineales bacterium]|nr:hypothetical protein [Anaerolineales bacterium]
MRKRKLTHAGVGLLKREPACMGLRPFAIHVLLRQFAARGKKGHRLHGCCGERSRDTEKVTDAGFLVKGLLIGFSIAAPVGQGGGG